MNPANVGRGTRGHPRIGFKTGGAFPKSPGKYMHINKAEDGMATVAPQKKGQKPIAFQKGGEHESLGVPKGQKIPASKKAAAAAGKFGPKAQKQENFRRNVLKGAKDGYPTPATGKLGDGGNPASATKGKTVEKAAKGKVVSSDERLKRGLAHMRPMGKGGVVAGVGEDDEEGEGILHRSTRPFFNRD